MAMPGLASVSCLLQLQQILPGRCGHQFPVLYSLGADQFVGQALDLAGFPLDHHHLQAVVGVEVDVARRLDLPVDVVMERVRVLTRRDAIGRTGVFRSVPVEDGMTFEQTLGSMADTTPAVRRQFRYRKEGR